MSKRRPLAVVGALAAVVVLLVVAGFAATWYAARQESQAKQTLAQGYEAHSLFSPFVLQSKTWQPSGGAFSSSGIWTYSYTTTASGSQALASATKQLSQGGYQIVATDPDITTSTQATLNRDLITGDDTIKVAINLVAKPTTATVTVSPLEGQ